jgi:phenylacetate-CoA ligase
MVISRNGNLDQVEVKVELKPDAAGIGAEGEARVIKALSHHIKSYIGISTAISVNAPGSLARSEGKARHVTDRR